MAGLVDQTFLPTQIPWVSCFPDLSAKVNANFECANLTVPIDYLAPESGTTQIGMAKARPFRLTNPMGLLFYDGCGDVGCSNIYWEAPNIGPLLNMTDNKYDIILVDHRGTGWSSPLTCGYTKQSLNTYFDNLDAFLLNVTNDLPLSTDYLTKTIDITQSLMTPNCGQNEDHNYLAHLTATDFARDIDLIRDLTGYQTLDFYGKNYASVIGITYAGLFSDRVGHIVVDDVRDFEAWVGSTGNVLDYSNEMSSNLPDITNQFASYCVAAAQVDTKYCPLAVASLNAPNPAADLVNRINKLTNYLSTVPEIYVPNLGETFNFIRLQSFIWYNLGFADAVNSWAQLYLNIEQAIQIQQSSHRMRRDSTSSGNLTYASLDSFNASNPFPVTYCLEASYANIDDIESFINYSSKRLAIAPFIGYRGLWQFGQCVGWPNRTSYNLEKFTGPFPSNISNKIVILGQTYNLGFPMSAALNTYNFVGSNNAALLIHDAFGANDPSDCIVGILQDYFINGNVPQNGTICRTDYSGMNNVFIQGYISADNSGSNSRLRIGLGLGLGLAFCIVLIVSAGYWNVRRKRRLG